MCCFFGAARSVAPHSTSQHTLEKYEIGSAAMRALGSAFTLDPSSTILKNPLPSNTRLDPLVTRLSRLIESLSNQSSGRRPQIGEVVHHSSQYLAAWCCHAPPTGPARFKRLFRCTRSFRAIFTSSTCDSSTDSIPICVAQASIVALRASDRLFSPFSDFFRRQHVRV